MGSEDKVYLGLRELTDGGWCVRHKYFGSTVKGPDSVDECNLSSEPMGGSSPGLRITCLVL